MPFAKLDSFLASCIDEKKVPGCVCWVGDPNHTLFFEAYGHTQTVPQETEMRKETVFDLASLTKPIVTALSIMLLQERGLVELGSRVVDILPGLKSTATGQKTLKQLLSHTSGLAAWYPTYLFPEETRLQGIAGLNTNEEEVVYSCLGYILLGKIIEQITHVSLADFFRQNIAERFDLMTMRFGTIKASDSVAPTELGNLHEKGMARQYGDLSGIEWREYLIHGEVHDGNAFYGFNGVAGNAGLFGNTEDVARFIRAYLAGEIVTSATISLMAEDLTGGDEKRGLGWKMDMYPGLLSPASFGHTGFTGTLLVVDPQPDLIIILLANAVHPTVKLNVMAPIRREAIRLIANAVTSK
jgi:CubicO group peptidase (beta-lactamase class C family)